MMMSTPVTKQMIKLICHSTIFIWVVFTFTFSSEVETDGDIASLRTTNHPWKGHVLWMSAFRLLALFVCRLQRARRLLRNNGACASLIGRCTSLPTSLSRVVGYAGTARLSCYYKCVAIGCRHFANRSKNICHSTLLSGKLLTTDNMDNRLRTADDASSSTDSSSDFHGNNLPPPDMLNRCPVQAWVERDRPINPDGFTLTVISAI